MPGPLDREKKFIEQRQRGIETPSVDRGAPERPAPGVDRNIRYRVVNGVTIAVPLDGDIASVVEAISAPVRPVFKIPPPPPKRPEEVVAPHLPSARPESDGEAAALWESLPRHVQILASLAAEAGEPTGERTFEETRPQLLSRLLDPALTLEETARLLDVCPATVRRYTNRGQLPHTRTIGQQRRFRLSEVLAFLEMRADRAADG
ncbi:MAG: helix-turn-helix domain-containing protein [Armatimonas sp.]